MLADGSGARLDIMRGWGWPSVSKPTGSVGQGISTFRGGTCLKAPGTWLRPLHMLPRRGSRDWLSAEIP